MPSEEKKIRIKPIMVALCDDVRQEANGKQTIIGMYVGGITVEKPESEKKNPVHGILSLNLWIPIEPPEVGSTNIEMQVIGPAPSNILKFGANLKFDVAPPAAEQSTMIFQGLPVNVDQEGNLEIMFRNEGDSEWQILKSVPITIKYGNHRLMAKVISSET